MVPATDGVKSQRRYDASGRRRRAAAARSRVIGTAGQLFLDRGYVGTSVGAIASAADVSERSVYLAFGGKAGLVRAIWQSGLAGNDPVPTPQRSDDMSSQELPPRAIIRAWATMTMEVAPRVAPIILLVRMAAATDREMADMLREINDERLERMQHNAERLFDRGGVRPDLSVAEARDVMFTYTAPELFEILVLAQRWTLQRYADFIDRGLAAELLDDRR